MQFQVFTVSEDGLSLHSSVLQLEKTNRVSGRPFRLHPEMFQYRLALLVNNVVRCTLKNKLHRVITEIYF